MLNLLLDKKRVLFTLALPGQRGQMSMFRVISDVRAQRMACIQYFLKLLVAHHVLVFSDFASMGENFIPVNPSMSQ